MELISKDYDKGYKKLIEMLRYYGTMYAIGDNLDKVIDGTDELFLVTATALESLCVIVENSLEQLQYITDKYCSNCGTKMDIEGD